MEDTKIFTLENLLHAEVLHAQMLLALANLEVTENRYSVTIPVNTRITTTAQGRKAFESQREHWRWGAGGLLIVLSLNDCEVALTRYRDAGAPSYADHYTLGSGLSASVREFRYPMETAIREGVEEFVVATPGGLMVPMVEGVDRETKNLAMLTAMANWVLIDGVPGLPSNFSDRRALFCAAKFADTLPEADVAFSFEGVEEETVSRALVVVDEGTRGIDLLKVLTVEVPYRLEDISILDGELNRGGQSLNGEVVCFAMEGGKFTWDVLAAFKSGRLITPTSKSRRATPPLKGVIDAMNA